MRNKPKLTLVDSIRAAAFTLATTALTFLPLSACASRPYTIDRPAIKKDKDKKINVGFLDDIMDVWIKDTPWGDINVHLAPGYETYFLSEPNDVFAIKDENFDGRAEYLRIMHPKDPTDPKMHRGDDSSAAQFNEADKIINYVKNLLITKGYISGQVTEYEALPKPTKPIPKPPKVKKVPKVEEPEKPRPPEKKYIAHENPPYTRDTNYVHPDDKNIWIYVDKKLPMHIKIMNSPWGNISCTLPTKRGYEFQLHCTKGIINIIDIDADGLADLIKNGSWKTRSESPENYVKIADQVLNYAIKKIRGIGFFKTVDHSYPPADYGKDKE